ncbi:helix-turn-helix family protein [Mycobacteroides abscessus 5S-0422]|uniref:Helix-turn-helix family protein n=1 Tax=Mycobacteroides abscessus subsp. bolletii 1513 TaxID=1299321 RepID=X8DKD8_9MYCO|nr:XRE family transcriptional regulator [Mycobacteroides abscessus]EUA68183.1 helix-turn-helix family protein [Mycobacteroides abscessus subsp. bolletii 1513]EIU06073.1 helix-turn-helix family protein [Mycobacteroides abscessus 5S-0421]EIU09573.1 helix-turn-helix family protein [Mycobacteroides abscessus 5S-0304]EIU19477.1 helix-turn-helix family protein [Mycobacteroides abscessus 5S-0422]EIU22156.1 helix-turn-helix family protein [Mycobacteroides abscessus 5S-0708]
MTAPSPVVEANSVMVQLTRLACGWSKKRLADEAGISASHVSRVESGVLPLAGKALLDYAQAMQCPPEALCVPFTRSPAEGTHFRANVSIAEWKRDRVWARANLVAMRIGRLAGRADIEPVFVLPELDPTNYAAEHGEITVAQVVRRLWRIAGPVRSMIELLEAAGVFVVVEDFRDQEIDAVTLRANQHHPHLVYVNAALPPDRMRMTLAHELGHLVMDAMTLVSPEETERRATAFAAEFLAPIDDIAFDLDRVSTRTMHELDELRLAWGVSVSSLVVRARERGILSEYQYRSMFRLLNETGRMYGPRPGVAQEDPKLVGAVLEQLAQSGYTAEELDDITLLTSTQRAALFQTARDTPATRHLAMV